MRKMTDEPALADLILEKMHVLPPPQALQVRSFNEKPLPGTDDDDPIVLTLVGKHFFRKGGLETVRVVSKLCDEGLPFELNVVSTLSPDRHTKPSGSQVAEAQAIIEKCPAIKVFHRLPNEQVIALFKRSHIGLLPSYVETYGYSVLEAQACGCPTITTDIFAFKEMNNDDIGWMISLGSDYDYKTQNGRRSISQRIEYGLEAILREIARDRDLVQMKGSAALRKIANEHSPVVHAVHLAQIYERAVSAPH